MLRSFLLAMGLSLAALPAAAFDINAMSADEKSAFGDAVRAYLMENPGVIMEAVEQLEQQQQAAQANADKTLVSDNAEAIFNDGYSWIGGNPDGDITLVEFLDYRCGYCKRAHPEVIKLMESDGNIRLIVKEFPILGDQSVLASRFAIATRMVAGQDAYKAVHDALMELKGDITMPRLTKMADALALDSAAIEKQMNADAVTNEIRATRALAQKLQISGTPSFVLHDEMLRGYLPFDQLEIIVADKRG